MNDNVINKIERGIITSIKITYDKKSNVPIEADKAIADIKYNLITAHGSHKSKGLKEINDIIKAYLESKPGITLRDLEVNGIVKLEGEAKIRYSLDYVNGIIVEKRLSRADRMRLSGRTYDDTPYKEETIVENPTPVVDTPTVTSPPPIVSATTEPDDTIRESTNKSEVIAEIIKLNPTVSMAVGKDMDGKDDHLYSTVSGDLLVLPDGFEYNEKNGITNKHNTKSGKYITIDVLPFVMNLDETKEDEEEETVVSDTKGKTDAIEKTEKKEKNVKPKIKNLKINNWKVLKRVIIGGLILTGLAYIAHNSRNNGNDEYIETDGERYYQEDGEYINMDDDYISPEAYPLYQEDNSYINMDDGLVHGDPLPEGKTYEEVYGNPAGNNYTEYDGYDGNMEEKMNEIVGTCYQNIGDVYNFLNGGALVDEMNPIYLEGMVPAGDRDAISVILNARNYVITNAYTDRSTPLTMSDVNRFLNDYVNYAFEGGSMFDGQAIKSFDYLDSTSQFIVTVVGESMLQLYPGFEYSSPYANYSYQDLINKVTAAHSDIAESLSNGRSY